MKLKTLKDLKIFDEDKSKVAMEYNYMIREELKAEAVNWVKNIDINKSADYCDGMMDFIMEFFNITEEDLK